MELGIGLPIGVRHDEYREWAARIEAGPYSTIGLLDRVVYPNPECLTALAVLSGWTERVRLQSEVLLAVLRDPVLLAKQCATLDAMSRGRFVLGVGVGSRPDDYQATGRSFHTRGRDLTECVGILRRTWSGRAVGDGVGPVGPLPHRAGGPPILFGGFTEPAVSRAARLGDGFLSAASPAKTAEYFRNFEAKWAEYARPGKPRLVAQLNVALGQPQADEAQEAMRDYYGRRMIAGVVPSDGIIKGLVTSEEALNAAMHELGEHGANEVICYLWTTDRGQIDTIASVWNAAQAA